MARHLIRVNQTLYEKYYLYETEGLRGLLEVLNKINFSKGRTIRWLI